MGVWESTRGHVSDDVADILDEAFDKIKKCWYGDEKENSLSSKRFSFIDLADAIEFCSRGILRVEINPEAEYLRDVTVDKLDPQYKRRSLDAAIISKRNEAHFKKTGVRTFDNRGQIENEF
jgi:hypothetical protein